MRIVDCGLPWLEDRGHRPAVGLRGYSIPAVVYTRVLLGNERSSVRLLRRHVISISLSMLLLIIAGLRAHLRWRRELADQIEVGRVGRPAASGMRVVSEGVPEVDGIVCMHRHQGEDVVDEAARVETVI